MLSRTRVSLPSGVLTIVTNKRHFFDGAEVNLEQMSPEQSPVERMNASFPIPTHILHDGRLITQTRESESVSRRFSVSAFLARVPVRTYGLWQHATGPVQSHGPVTALHHQRRSGDEPILTTLAFLPASFLYGGHT